MDNNVSYRLELHNILLSMGNNLHVYFQPPSNVCLVYPCIVYKRSVIENVSADNINYAQHTNYEVTVIDYNPDSNIVLNVSKLKKCRHIRTFTSDGLNHDVFSIYY